MKKICATLPVVVLAGCATVFSPISEKPEILSKPLVLADEPSRLEIAGYGESRLLDPSSPFNEINRRVRISVIADN